MMTVLLWKEYRQQRLFWVTVALVGLLVGIGLTMTGQPASDWRVKDFSLARNFLDLLLLSLAATQGMVTGALLLAGEKEDGTLPYLDYLAGTRWSVWWRKLVIGALFTLLQTGFLASLTLFLGRIDLEMAASFLFVGIDGLACGLLGGTLCRTTLGSALLGLLPLAGSYLVVSILTASYWYAFLEEEQIFAVAAKVLAIILTLGGSSLVFCRLRTSIETRSWRVVVWLAARQGWQVLASCMLAILLLAQAPGRWAIFLWPVVMTLIGVSCGLGAFGGDQAGGNHFLGAQRFPVGIIWSTKVIFWGASVLCFNVLGGLLRWSHDLSRYSTWRVESNVLEQVVLSTYFEQGSFPLVCLGSFHAFAIGLLFGQVMRRPVLAAILGVSLSLYVVLLFILIRCSGSEPRWWENFILPVGLLVLSRLWMWRWVCGRQFNPA